ncbi:MAG: glycosyltransferase family 2 protein [Minwuiales bacterium]|nr:glycosyltransferase family 2 protein [Minwuiales bacterium]
MQPSQSVDRSALLSVVVPAYNEQEVLETFHDRLSAVLATLPFGAEVIYVNDGSGDDTLSILRGLRRRDPRVAVIDLSRNFGKEIALTAGLDHARGDAVIVIDADLQDPPELIPKLIEPWRDEGYDVVYAQRMSRAGESWLKKKTASWFYRLMQHVGEIPIPPDTGDFRLLSRRTVDSIRSLRERHRFMKGLFTWVGFRQCAVAYERDARGAGESKWNYWRLWNLALEGVTSATLVPLKVSSYIGLIIAVLAFATGIWIIFKTLAFGDPVQGWPSLMVVVLFLGGVQLVALGVIGEYLGRLFNEAKGRPLYFLNTVELPEQSREE